MKAGVSRVTYYRNFETKHDVIRAFFREWGKNFSSEIRKVQRDLTAEKVARLAFEQFKLEKDKMKLLRKNHLIYLYLESLTNGFRDLFLQFGKLRVEQSYILSGGLFNFSVWWLEEDCKTPVDDMVANLIVAQLLLLDSENPEKDIMLYINSPGGSVTAGLAIYDTMQHIRADVQTICLGQAASMGAFLLCSGAKGKRMALPHSRVLIHQPLGGAQGQATDIEIQAQEILRIKKTLNEIMASNTGQSIKKIEKDTDRDYIMTPQEALEYGMLEIVIPKDAM